MNASPRNIQSFNAWLLLGGILTLLVLLIAAFYLVELYRGNSRLKEVETALQAKGESLDWRDLVPAQVDEGQNLAAIPLFRPLWATLSKDSTMKLEDTPEGRRLLELTLNEDRRSLPKKSNPARGEPIDLVAWQKYFAESKKFPHPATPGTAAADVLLALDLFQPELGELRAASADRTYLQFPIRLDEGMAMRLPHWIRMQKIVEILALRASSLLFENRAKEAFADLTLAQNLVPTPDDERTLISFLVSVTCQTILRKPILEGLEAHRWDARQLNQMQGWQSSVNYLDYFQKAARIERALAVELYADLNEDPASAFSADGMVAPPLTQASRLIPRGWIMQNEALQEELMQRFFVEAFDPSKNVARFPGSLEETLLSRPLPYAMLAKMMVPVLEKLSINAARTQCDLQQTAIACSLERYRLEHQHFPSSLGELDLAEMVRQDLITGQPMTYFLEGNTFTLYSVGWNRTDDGGKVVFKTGLNTSVDQEQGDWVWPHLRW